MTTKLCSSLNNLSFLQEHGESCQQKSITLLQAKIIVGIDSNENMTSTSTATDTKDYTQTSQEASIVQQ